MRINYFEEEVRNIILTGTGIAEGPSEVVLKATVEFDNGSKRGPYWVLKEFGDCSLFEEYMEYINEQLNSDEKYDYRHFENLELSFEDYKLFHTKKFKKLFQLSIVIDNEDDEW